MINKNKVKKIAYIGLSLCFLISCQNKEKLTEKQQESQQIVQMVPGAGNAWKSVRLIIKNKKDPKDKGKDFDVEIGVNPVSIPNTNLKIKIEEFYPDFCMDGQGKAGSKSTTLNNPAARIIVEQEGKPPYQGWLFANYPDVHEFPSEEISIRLNDFIKK
ncbi:MAG: hypothetical protein AB1498_10765 [bacterium]